MKDFAKSIVCNTKVGNSNKTEIIEKKKKEGATLKVDNGQKLEFSDGSTYVKTSFSDDYREAHNHVGNSYSWSQRRGHEELYDPTVPFGGHVRGYVEKTKKGYIGAKTNGSIIISQKEFATEEEAKKFVENSKVGNNVLSEKGNKNPDWNVGNFDWDVGIFNGQWYITKNGQKFKGPFVSMQAAARYLDGHKWEFEGKLAKSKTGNKKVGNADIYSGNYIIMGDDGDVWFRDEHEDVSIKYIDSWAQKKIAAYQRSIDEIKKGVQEAKQQAKKYGLL